MNVDSNIVQWIEEKSIKENSADLLQAVSKDIKKLDDHINSRLSLSKEEIDEALSTIIGFATFTLDCPVSNLSFLRARLRQSNNFESVDELSYIKSPTESFPSKGRLNQQGQSLFYASIPIGHDDHALSVILSEVRAKKLDTFNILRSKQRAGQKLSLRMIAIWDDIRRGTKPTYLPDSVSSYYDEVWKLMQEKFDDKLLLAFTLADRFLADIMSRQGHDRLYDVTSIASKIILDSEDVDGILYTSVQAKGSPVIALKPEAVDRALELSQVSSVFVQEHFGYEFYLSQTTRVSTGINPCSGSISW